jgi:8-oxo-dGTP diphosphatase
MPISEFMAGLRTQVGHDLLMMPSAAGIVRDDQGRVLLQRRSDTGGWCIPGGAIDPDEQPAQACVREIYEETGLVVRPVGLLGVETHPITTYPNGDIAQAIVCAFDCVIVGGQLESRDGESAELAFFDVADLPRGEFMDRVQPQVFERGRSTAAFVWDEDWLRM